MSRLLPAKPVPDLTVPLVGGATWTLSEQKPETFTVVDIYRHHHDDVLEAIDMIRARNHPPRGDYVDGEAAE